MLCQRWGQVPSALLAEDAGIVYGILSSLDRGDGAGEPDMVSMLIDRAEVVA